MEEKQIQTIRTTQKLSYFEAKKQVSISLPKTNVSYAKAVKTTTCSIGIQTDVINTSTTKPAEEMKPPKTRIEPPAANTNSSSLSKAIRKPGPLSKTQSTLALNRSTEDLSNRKIKIQRTIELNKSKTTLTRNESDNNLSDMEIEKGLETPSNLTPKNKTSKDLSKPPIT